MTDLLLGRLEGQPRIPKDHTVIPPDIKSNLTHFWNPVISRRNKRPIESHPLDPLGVHWCALTSERVELAVLGPHSQKPRPLTARRHFCKEVHHGAAQRPRSGHRVGHEDVAQRVPNEEVLLPVKNWNWKAP